MTYNKSPERSEDFLDKFWKDFKILLEQGKRISCVATQGNLTHRFTIRKIENLYELPYQNFERFKDLKRYLLSEFNSVNCSVKLEDFVYNFRLK